MVLLNGVYSKSTLLHLSCLPVLGAIGLSPMRCLSPDPLRWICTGRCGTTYMYGSELDLSCFVVVSRYPCHVPIFRQSTCSIDPCTDRGQSIAGLSMSSMLSTLHGCETCCSETGPRQFEFRARNQEQLDSIFTSRASHSIGGYS